VKIVADNAIPFLKGVLEPYARVEYLPGKTIATADVRDADALIVRTRTRCDAALLEGSSVKLIATATIGFDHIDTASKLRPPQDAMHGAYCNTSLQRWSDSRESGTGSLRTKPSESSA